MRIVIDLCIAFDIIIIKKMFLINLNQQMPASVVNQKINRMTVSVSPILDITTKDNTGDRSSITTCLEQNSINLCLSTYN